MKFSFSKLLNVLRIAVQRCYLFCRRSLIALFFHIRSWVRRIWDKLLDQHVQLRTRELEEKIRILESTRDSKSRQLAVEETMAVCSRFAGGVAHDLNNILSGLVTFPEMLLSDLPDDSPLVKPLNAILRSGIRASHVSADLVAMSRGLSGNKVVLGINAVINRFFESDICKTILQVHPDLTVLRDPEPALLYIHAASDHIETILKNMITHCCHAMAGEGRLLIQTRNVYVDTDQEDATFSIPPGEYVCLSFSDTGIEISQADLACLFEPYYCRKVMERSCSGMGLSIVWNMVASSRGAILSRSSEEGSVYDLYFPVVREALTTEADSDTASDTVQGGGESILVIDDDELQRHIASEVLTRAGYSVHTVSSGDQAIDRLAKTPFDLIVLDMIMPPGINGYETYKRIIAIRPGQKAIIASGFSRTAEVEKTQGLGAGAYIRKPYLVNELLTAVHRELHYR